MSLLAGCGSDKGPNYISTTYGLDPNFNVIEMKTFDPLSEEFRFRYDNTVWRVEERPEEEAPNKVALVHTAYDDDDQYECVLLPGTIGRGLEEGNQASEGTLLTQKHVARTIDVFNPIGVHLMHVVGYEVNGLPYIFETNMPSRDPETCEAASQAIVSTFDLKNPVVTNDAEDADEDGEEDEGEEETEETVESTFTIGGGE
jgi:predicted Zn-dependent protease with MMP-like domain